MKKILFLMTLLVVGVSFAFAQTNADIKFDKTTHDFGKFSENSPVVSCVFTFTNIGDAPLVIHQAVASCGCTVPDYTKEPILPGKTGTISQRIAMVIQDGDYATAGVWVAIVIFIAFLIIVLMNLVSNRGMRQVKRW